MNRSEADKLRNDVRDIYTELCELQNRLYSLGLIKTAHAANAAANALGWEAAEKLMKSGLIKKAHDYNATAQALVWESAEATEKFVKSNKIKKATGKKP